MPQWSFLSLGELVLVVLLLALGALHALGPSARRWRRKSRAEDARAVAVAQAEVAAAAWRAELGKLWPVFAPFLTPLVSLLAFGTTKPPCGCQGHAPAPAAAPFISHETWAQMAPAERLAYQAEVERYLQAHPELRGVPRRAPSPTEQDGGGVVMQPMPQPSELRPNG